MKAKDKTKCSKCEDISVEYCPVIGKDIDFNPFCKKHLKDGEKVISDTLDKISLKP